MDLSESLIDAYGEGGPVILLLFFTHQSPSLFIDKHIYRRGDWWRYGTFVAGGLLHAMFKSSSKLVTIGGSVIATGALLYGAKAIAVDPGLEIVKLQREREYALANNDYKLDRCLALAQRKSAPGLPLTQRRFF